MVKDEGPGITKQNHQTNCHAVNFVASARGKEWYCAPYDGQQRTKTDLRFVTKETGESPLQAGMVNLTGTPSARALLYQLYENIRTPSTQAPGLPPTTGSQILRTLRHYNYRISQRFDICTLERAETSTNHFSRRSSRRSRTDKHQESGYCAWT